MYIDWFYEPNENPLRNVSIFHLIAYYLLFFNESEFIVSVSKMDVETCPALTCTQFYQ